MDILQEIARRTKERVVALKKEIPLSSVKRAALKADITPPSFRDALRREPIALICEVKRASPSKGMIRQDFPYLNIAKEYEKAGAAAISCLTEPFYFMGKSQYLREIASAVKLPVLRKDFIVDEYMIYETKLIGASAILLICSLLPPKRLKEYLDLAHSLGLSALVEAHDEAEVASAVEAGAQIIGINNRNLRDFTVDLSLSTRLRELVPRDRIFVSESGIRTPEDIQRLRESGVNAVLIGETLMKSGNITEEIRRLKNEA
ncbi:MAG: indole-3-glycerol phosphate synthase TrpC [Bacteroides sp.]|nr:indole-3-glycerol phosphate synthase TrpC [Eubacterium sp.]MCM1417266.1 indole-3-glycerol phosphate synthase TrpC [Roseburia sp.]MCM1461114.1 indole-3-glycerol phosphate synthase TrpC [Bacteroides sp.]